jgi:predicted ABC-type sugar transport system permease subunit
MKQIASKPAPGASSRVSGLFRNQGLTMLVILVVMWAVLALLSPYFFTVDNLFEITLQTSQAVLTCRSGPSSPAQP